MYDQQLPHALLHKGTTVACFDSRTNWDTTCAHRHHQNPPSCLLMGHCGHIVQPEHNHWSCPGLSGGLTILCPDGNNGSVRTLNRWFRPDMTTGLYPDLSLFMQSFTFPHMFNDGASTGSSCLAVPYMSTAASSAQQLVRGSGSLA